MATIVPYLQYRALHFICYCSDCTERWKKEIEKNVSLSAPEPFSNINPPLGPYFGCASCGNELHDPYIHVAGYYLCLNCIDGMHDVTHMDDENETNDDSDKEKPKSNEISLKDSLIEYFGPFCKKEPTEKRKKELDQMPEQYQNGGFNIFSLGPLNLDEAIHIAANTEKSVLQVDVGNILSRAFLPLFLSEEIIYKILSLKDPSELHTPTLISLFHFPHLLTAKILKAIESLEKSVKETWNNIHFWGRGFPTIGSVAEAVLNTPKEKPNVHCQFCGKRKDEVTHLISPYVGGTPYADPHICSFCARHKDDVIKLVTASDEATICDECILNFFKRIKSTHPSFCKSGRVGNIWQHDDRIPSARICSECICLCEELIEKE